MADTLFKPGQKVWHISSGPEQHGLLVLEVLKFHMPIRYRCRRLSDLVTDMFYEFELTVHDEPQRRLRESESRR